MDIKFEYAEKLDAALEIVNIAAKELKDIDFSSLKVNNKNEDIQDLVTNYDILVEKRIVEYLSMMFPDDGFITEEKTVDYEERVGLWILDPIDGTTNFVYALQNYAISLAYYDNKKEIFGIVLDVSRDECFVGIKGNGAYLNNNRLPKLSYRDINHSVIDISLRAVYRFEKRFKMNFEALSNDAVAFRSIGSAALGLSHVALGSLQYYCSSSLKLWDYAASKIILEEVGGYVEVEPNKKYSESHLVIGGFSQQAIADFKNYQK